MSFVDGSARGGSGRISGEWCADQAWAGGCPPGGGHRALSPLRSDQAPFGVLSAEAV